MKHLIAAGVLLSLFAGKAAAGSPVEQGPTAEEKSWTHSVTEGGDWQIGSAWVHLVKPGAVEIQILRNGRLEASFPFESGKKVEPYDGPLLRFPKRLEGLRAGDVVTVKALPRRGAVYELKFHLVCGTPNLQGRALFPVSRYGAAGDGVANDLPAVWRATAEAVKAGGGVVQFEKGRKYRLMVPESESGTDKKYVFQLSGSRNLEFQGQGAHLILHPKRLGLLAFEDCENVKVTGFSQTFDPQPYYQGTVVSLDPANLTGVIQVPPGDGVPSVGPVAGAHVFARSLSAPLESPCPGYIRSEHLYLEKTEALPEDPRRIHITFRAKSKMQLGRAKENGVVGNLLIMPHLLYGHDSGGHVLIERSGRITLDQVWIQSMANMGIIPKHNWGPITFSRTDLRTAKPETERFVAWRDGFHVRDNRMGILIEDGNYDGGLLYDDIFSPHSMLNKVEKIEGGNGAEPTLLVRGLSPESMFHKGDWISVWDPRQTNTGKGLARVSGTRPSKVPPVGSEQSVFTLVLDRPMDVRPGDYLYNEETLNWDMVIRRCTHSGLGKMGTTRWRTPVRIEDCRFSNLTVNIYAADAATLERPRPRHIVVERTFLEERMNFRCSDAWDVKLSDVDFLSRAMVDLIDTDDFVLDNVRWTNASPGQIRVKGSTGVTFRGKNGFGAVEDPRSLVENKDGLGRISVDPSR